MQVSLLPVQVNSASSLSESVKGSMTINRFIFPFSKSKASSLTLSNEQKVILTLEKMPKECSVDFANILSTLASIPPIEGKEASIEHLSIITKELAQPIYTPRDRKQIFLWNLQLTLQHLRGDAFVEDEKAHELGKKLNNPNQYQITKRETLGHSPSFAVIDKETGSQFAILKESKPLRYNTFQSRYLPEMPIKGKVWHYEVIGYEQDRLFGLNQAPVTIGVKFTNEESKPAQGTVQKFIKNAKAGSELYSPEGAKLLLAIPKTQVHRTALAGFFRGLAAGHMSNYLLKLTQDNQTIKKIYEIDLEEMLPPYNRLPDTEKMTGYAVADAEQRAMAYQSLVLCRMWILGLPQNDQPLDKALLLTLTHPAFLTVLQTYHENALEYSKITKESWNAQRERLEEMQLLFQEELKKEQITLTPREVYFKIFGGEHLWKIAQEKNYPAMMAFNNLISDPYQHIVKDFSNPHAIPECNRLEQPRDDSAEQIEITNFLRVMGGLPTLEAA